jgi:hypothetical protein
MTLPFNLPAWLPWWVPLVCLVPILLWLLAFLLVPFSVIGLKARLDGLEARLDELHAEIRTLSIRMPENAPSVDFDEIYHPQQSAPQPQPRVVRRPPIPPATHELEADQARPERRPADTRRDRTEPKLDWPR